MRPPLLAGRDSELKAAESPLSDPGRGGSPSQDLLFYRPRGNGTTTLLLELKRRSRERGFRVETLSVAALTEKRTSIRLLQQRSGRAGGAGRRRQITVHHGAASTSPESQRSSFPVWSRRPARADSR